MHTTTEVTALPSDTREDFYSVHANAFRFVIGATEPSRSTDTSRPVLCSWLVTADADHDKGTVTYQAVTTDSYRLTIARATVVEDSRSARVGLENLRILFGEGHKLRDISVISKGTATKVPDARITVEHEHGGPLGPKVSLVENHSGARTVELGASDPESFPSYKSLIPEAGDYEGPARFNPAYLADLYQQMKLAHKCAGARPSDYASIPVKFERLHELKPSLISWSATRVAGIDSAEVRTVLMPVRAS